MNRSSLHISTRVLPGHKIEIETPELSVGEVVEVVIVRESSIENPPKTEIDPLIGLFEGPADLATRSEEILPREIQDKSGWTWKNQ